MSDSAFRRLLLDTVSTAISQPPSSASLIELLRISQPALGRSRSRLDAEAKVRDAPQRERMFRSLQSRIHPDKHGGDERATILFQEVTIYYGRCVEALEKEDRRHHAGATTDENERSTDKTRDGPSAPSSNGNGGKHDDSDTMHSRFPQWYPWWHRQKRPQGPRPPKTDGADVDAGTRSTHSDYENCDFEEGHPNRQRPWRRKNDASRNREPPSHQAFAVISLLLFPPLGLCALLHSYRVRRAWDEGRCHDARHHSAQAYSYAWYGCLCFACVLLFLWLGDGDLDWDWDRMKRNFSWNDGP